MSTLALYVQANTASLASTVLQYALLARCMLAWGAC